MFAAPALSMNGGRKMYAQMVCRNAALGYDGRIVAEKLDFRADFRLYLYTGFGHAAFDTAPDYRERLVRFFTQ